MKQNTNGFASAFQTGNQAGKRRPSRIGAFFCMVLLVTVALLSVGCGNKNLEALGVPEDRVVMGEGSKQFFFWVEYKDETTDWYEIHTDKETVGEALVEQSLIAGEMGAYGLYVKSVNGVVADYDIDQTYWAFFVNDEFASAGVDQTEINEEEIYSLRVRN